MRSACLLVFACVACGSPQAPVVAAEVATVPSASNAPSAPAAPTSEKKGGLVYSLPTIKSGEPLSPARFTIKVRDGALFLNGDSIAKIPADSSHGFDAEYKRSGPNDLYLVPLADKVKAAPPQSDAAAKTVRLELAPTVSYRMLIEILFTLGQSEMTTFAIAAPSSNGQLTEIRIVPPKAASELKSVLGLTVLATTEGIAIKARGGNVAPGCTDTGAGLAFKSEGAGYRVADTVACLRMLKSVAVGFDDETTATFSASPGVLLPDVITLVDAIRGEKRDLFPNVFFGVSR